MKPLKLISKKKAEAEKSPLQPQTTSSPTPKKSISKKKKSEFQLINNIKAIRTKHNITQKEIAKFLGVGQPSVVAYEKQETLGKSYQRFLTYVFFLAEETGESIHDIIITKKNE